MAGRAWLRSTRWNRSAALAATLLLAALAACSDDPVSPDPAAGLEYVTPEDVGWSSAKLADVESLAVRSGYAAIMAAYDGKVFFSWGDVTRNFRCHSIRKPFLSALYGKRLARGELQRDATLEQLGIDDIPPSLTAEEKQATLRQLLQSRSGVYHAAAAETDEMAAARPPRGSHPPGTFFYYNNWDFNALGTIYRDETGRDVFEAFRDEIACPIGMQDFDVANCAYEYEPDKSEHPAYAFRMSARDMTRFGVLYQKGGRWQGRQVVPAAWIEECTRTYSVTDSASGVGYGQMWYTVPEGSQVAQMLGSAGYYHTGIGVHILTVLPAQKLVIVERYDTDGAWTDPGEVGLQIGLMIIEAKVDAGVGDAHQADRPHHSSR